jgi:sugar transferase (PEP-CTERM system associated)
MGMFSRRLRDKMSGIVLRITLSVLAGSALGGSLLALLPAYQASLEQILTFAGIAWIVLIVVHRVVRGVVDEDIFKSNVLVYGAGVSAARIAQLRRHAYRGGFQVVGYVPAELLITTEAPLRDLAQRFEIDEIVVAMDDRRQQFPLKELLDARLAGIEILDLATFLERETGKVYLDILFPSWMIFGEGFRRDMFRLVTERGFDLIASLLLLVLAMPVMLLTSLAIKLEEGPRAPLLYRQARVGYAGRVFNVLKFRSMRTDAERDGKAQWASANDTRVTRVGRFIRKVRIDELPQLLNVLRGQMSFVGPRPERPEFVQQLAETIPYYDERHAVKPGITGWAQLCYPYGASEQDAVEKLQYDLYYVKNHGLLFDIFILLQTVEVILLGKGAR